MMKYKMLCTDMDGTLLNDEKKISEASLEAIQKAHEKGVKIVICTGRMFASAKFYAELIGVKTPVIAANGAYIREKDQDETVYKSILGLESCRKALALLKSYDICPNFHTEDKIFIENVPKITQWYENINKGLKKENNLDIRIVDDWETVFQKYENDIVKCIAMHEDIANLNAAKQEFIKQNEFEVASSRYDNFEVMQKGVSKGRAVEILAGYYNIKPEEIICIGDNENDISMIQYAGLGVAMGNAESYVKKNANYITANNNEDGVAKVIHKFMLEEV